MPNALIALLAGWLLAAPATVSACPDGSTAPPPPITVEQGEILEA